MDYLPIFLNIENRPCLVIGGGEVAARKVGLLLDAGGEVTVVAPELCEAFRRARKPGKSTTSRPLTTRPAREQCPDHRRHQRSRGQSPGGGAGARAEHPVNVVDDPHDGSFIMPSIIDRSPVVAAVSTGGASRYWRGSSARASNPSSPPATGAWRNSPPAFARR